jgi:hypothetical protein
VPRVVRGVGEEEAHGLDQSEGERDSVLETRRPPFGLTHALDYWRLLALTPMRMRVGTPPSPPIRRAVRVCLRRQIC